MSNILHVYVEISHSKDSTTMIVTRCPYCKCVHYHVEQDVDNEGVRVAGCERGSYYLQIKDK